MKHFLLLILFVCSIGSLQSQIVSGTKLSGNIAGTDINGKAVDIFADLSAGKTVILDVFAT
ncbi:MAG: hypothetical protein IPP49_17835 [Saprospiraceae bacterium]|nr:hypothetical protein [Saprospiraceae bacterium]